MIQKLTFPIQIALLKRAEEAAKIAGISAEDLTRVGLIRACAEIELTGQIAVGPALSGKEAR